MTRWILIATADDILRVDVELSAVHPREISGGIHPTDLAADPLVSGRAWCCTREHGVFRTEDAGATWLPSGLESERLMTIAASPARRDLVWAGCEPSAIWRSEDGGQRWEAATELVSLPSSSTWAFPPRPETHHVRWITPHPTDSDRLWVAIEAGALILSTDGGRTWRDRVAGGPYDTHELAVHPAAPEVLRSAAGDGYLESSDGGTGWVSPMTGLEVGYLRSVAIDPGNPEVAIVSAASGPRRAYVAGRSDGRVYRREGNGQWSRVVAGWPDPPSTTAPLLAAGRAPGEFWAADERGLHRSEDSGRSWSMVASFDRTPDHIRGLAVLLD